jgi:uncharacterized protein (TIGR02246 family)
MSDAPIRQFFEEWHRATIAEDTARLLDLMAEDVVFLSPGQPPMQGRDAFAKAFTDASNTSALSPPAPSTTSPSTATRPAAGPNSPSP